jgi:hypothetical protein
VEQRTKRENLEYHNTYHLDKVKHIQIKYRAIKACPKKLDVRRFKALLYGSLLGWKIRRIIAYMKTIPVIKESIDYVSLRNDITDSNPTDLFSIQIIERYPEMIRTFQTKFFDLNENAVWIKKPKTFTPTKARNRPSFKKERSKPSKIPPKQTKKAEESNRRRTFTYTRKTAPQASNKPQALSKTDSSKKSERSSKGLEDVKEVTETQPG